MTRLIARITGNELLRRRGVLALMLALPLLFFVIRLDTYWTALRMLAIGLGWSMAALALFTQVSALRINGRLIVAGASVSALHLGRQLALWAGGLTLALMYFVVVTLTIAGDLAHLAPVLLALCLTVMISVPLGTVVAAAVPRELEGSLVLLGVMAVQLLVEPAAGWTRILPLWSTRELASYIIGPAGEDHLIRGTLHGIGYTLALSLLAWLLTRRLLRPAPIAMPA